MVPLLFPAGILLAFLVSRAFPSLSETLVVAIAIGFPITAVSAYAAVDRRRKQRAAGLVPPPAGYSARLGLLAAKLRERADALDSALRLGRAIEPAGELESFAVEVVRAASQLDGRELLAGLSVWHPQESYLGGGPMPEHAPAALAQHARRLRGAADEIDAYAAELRARGGLYRVSAGERLGCGIVLLGISAAGVWLLVGALRGGGSPWPGAGLIAFGVLAAWAVVASQREPA